MYEILYNSQRYSFDSLEEAIASYDAISAEMEVFDDLYPVSFRNDTEFIPHLYPKLRESFFRVREQDLPDWEGFNG